MYASLMGTFDLLAPINYIGFTSVGKSIATVVDRTDPWVLPSPLYRYTRYSKKTKHLKMPLHTNRSQINTLMFVTWLKPLRGKQSTAPTK